MPNARIERQIGLGKLMIQLKTRFVFNLNSLGFDTIDDG